MKQDHFPLVTLCLLVTFAAVNAVLSTPALPDIANYFSVSSNAAQQTVTCFLMGYTLGQLLYGPPANRFGRKPTLYAGIGLQIASSLLCVLAGALNNFHLMVAGRFLLALGSGVGLKITFTLLADSYEPADASKKLSYLVFSFAIIPSAALALGGLLNTYFGWASCFYAGAIYGIIVLILAMRLRETQTILNLAALNIKHLLNSYEAQFKNPQLITGGLITGCATAFFYVFSTLAPFIAINEAGMNSSQFGIANALSLAGLMSGSLLSTVLMKHCSLATLMRTGIITSGLGSLFMWIAMVMHLPIMVSLFLTTGIIYMGTAMVLASAPSIAMSSTHDKSHGSAVMNFVNIGLATLVVLGIGFFPTHTLLLPIINILLCGAMLGINPRHCQA